MEAHSYSFLSIGPGDLTLFLHLLMKTFSVYIFLLMHMKYSWSFIIMYILITMDVSGCIQTDVKYTHHMKTEANFEWGMLG